MDAFSQWGQCFADLFVNTVKLWRALWPKLIGTYVITYTVSRLLQIASAWAGTLIPPRAYEWVGETSKLEVTKNAVWPQWLAVVLLSLSFLVILTGIIIVLRSIGQYLEAESALPADAYGPATRQSLPQALAVTLLAFLGIYSVFDYIGDTASRVMVDAYLITHDPIDLILQPLMPADWNETVIVVAVILGAFILRRIVDLIGQRTGRIWMGFVAAAFESFYLLAFFVAGRRAVARVWTWVNDRQIVDATRRPLRELKEWIGISIPDLLHDLWNWFWSFGWPTILASFTQPVLWFALAALVLGSQIRSFGELLHSGRLHELAADRKRLSALGTKVEDERRREVLVQIQDAVFGDLDEKYLPVWQVLKLTWKAGAGFLAAFIVAFNLIEWTETWLWYGIGVVLGEPSYEAGVLYDEIIHFVLEPLVMTFQLAMLGAGYAMAFSRMTAGPSPAPTPSSPTPSSRDLLTPSSRGPEGTRDLRTESGSTSTAEALS
jgi:hypothetical protein